MRVSYDRIPYLRPKIEVSSIFGVSDAFGQSNVESLHEGNWTNWRKFTVVRLFEQFGTRVGEIYLRNY